jgi:hypothetical protein
MISLRRPFKGGSMAFVLKSQERLGAQVSQTADLTAVATGPSSFCVE